MILFSMWKRCVVDCACPVTFLFVLLSIVECYPEQGKWSLHISQNERFLAAHKSMAHGDHVRLNIHCHSPSSSVSSSILPSSSSSNAAVAATTTNVTVGWVIHSTQCWKVFVGLPDQGNSSGVLAKLYDSHSQLNGSLLLRYNEITGPCNQLNLPTVKFGTKSRLPAAMMKTSSSLVPQQPARSAGNSSLAQRRMRRRSAAEHSSRALYVVEYSAIYLLVVHVKFDQRPPDGSEVHVTMEMTSTNGSYLSTADWPNLPFYGCMTCIYVLYLVFWLAVCCKHWHELLRIQYWIGAVIVMGFVEKASFLAVYDRVNREGVVPYNTLVLAELVSCAKRALARVLLVIVSVGFGITKPRLGPLLQRVLCVGGVYFLLAAVESGSRQLRPVAHWSNDLVAVSVALSLCDAVLCWWVFSALVSTMRTLRLRRNEVKLSVFRQLVATLGACVSLSVVVMLWSTREHKWGECVTDWRRLWLDDATWHVMFSALLLVIMLLFRPANNNQRYAFTPLLDVGDGDMGDEDEEEEELFCSEAFQDVKNRGRHASTSSRERSTRTSDEDLKWVEDNIPSSMVDTALPLVDSDEEMATTRMEVNKMQ